MAQGEIVQCIGAVVDCEFPRNAMPKVYDALKLVGSDSGLTLEVQQQLGDGVVRAAVIATVFWGIVGFLVGDVIAGLCGRWFGLPDAADSSAAMALNGGLGLLHYNMPEADQVAEVRRVKNHIHGMIGDPAVVSADDTIAEVLARIERDGLAFSSRNAYLAGEERRQAVALWRGLAAARARSRSPEIGRAHV